jgi:hypothetical protein
MGEAAGGEQHRIELGAVAHFAQVAAECGVQLEPGCLLIRRWQDRRAEFDCYTLRPYVLLWRPGLEMGRRRASAGARVVREPTSRRSPRSLLGREERATVDAAALRVLLGLTVLARCREVCDAPWVGERHLRTSFAEASGRITPSLRRSAPRTFGRKIARAPPVDR